MPEPPQQQPLPWLRLLTGASPAGATRVPAAACRTRAGLFTELAARLRLPGYFGHNWDALADCLTDLVGDAPLTLVVDDAVQLLADEPPAQLATLLTLLGDVAAGRPAGLQVLLRCEPADEPALRRRITAATSRG